MKTLTRDISVTLIIKLALLFVLWFVCFKDTRKPVQNTDAWLFEAKAISNVIPAEDVHSSLL